MFHWYCWHMVSGNHDYQTKYPCRMNCIAICSIPFQAFPNIDIVFSSFPIMQLIFNLCIVVIDVNYLGQPKMFKTWLWWPQCYKLPFFIEAEKWTNFALGGVQVTVENIVEQHKFSHTDIGIRPQRRGRMTTLLYNFSHIGTFHSQGLFAL